MKIYDISPAVAEGFPVWPGDTPLTRERLLRLEAGDAVELSTLRATVHLGAHADAPSHCTAGAPSIERLPLETYLGRCQLLRLRVARGRRIDPADLPAAVECERLLLDTGTFPDPQVLNRDFAAPSVELVRHLAGRGVRLLGLDAPSVDLFDSEELPVHHACGRHGVAILEGLRLAGVPEGVYELIALPLRLAGFEASPVRAVLRELA